MAAGAVGLGQCGWRREEGGGRPAGAAAPLPPVSLRDVLASGLSVVAHTGRQAARRHPRQLAPELSRARAPSRPPGFPAGTGLPTDAPWAHAGPMPWRGAREAESGSSVSAGAAATGTPPPTVPAPAVLCATGGACGHAARATLCAFVHAAAQSVVLGALPRGPRARWQSPVSAHTLPGVWQGDPRASPERPSRRGSV